MLPMGTIVTVLMFIGVIIAADLPVVKKLPDGLRRFAAVLVFMGGAWNTFWYGLQHLSEFWGFSALISGILMMVTALYVMAPDALSGLFQKFKPIVLVVLFGYALMYAITIARL